MDGLHQITAIHALDGRRRSMRHPHSRLASTLLISLVLLASACTLSPSTAGSPTPAATSLPTATPAPHAVATAVDGGSVNIPAKTTKTFSATCPNGTTLVGGGYNFNTTTTTAWGADDSYPSSATTWTVALRTQVPTALTAIAVAVCVQANFAFTATGLASATCPNGTTLSGGGYKADMGYSGGSKPVGNSWQVHENGGFGTTPSVTAYAICVSAPLKLAGVQSSSITLAVDQSQGTGITCQQGQLGTGGGYDFAYQSTDGTTVFYSSYPQTGPNDPTSFGWQGGAQDVFIAPRPLTVYGVCLTY
jgi:hypothetical protein